MSINLVPWREERRKRRQKDFVNKIGFSSLAGLAIVILLGISVNSLISGQEKRNDFLSSHIKTAKANIVKIKHLEEKKKEIISREKIINGLRVNRDLLPHILYQLAIQAENGIINNKLSYKNNLLTIHGQAINNSDVATYINNLKQSKWFKDPKIIIIENKKRKHPFNKKEISIKQQRLNEYKYSYIIQTKINNPYIKKENITDNNKQKK